MNTEINKALEACYELEGLLLLSAQKGADAPAALRSMMQDKIDAIKSYLSAITAFDSDEPIVEETIPVVDDGLESAVVTLPEPDEEYMEPVAIAEEADIDDDPVAESAAIDDIGGDDEVEDFDDETEKSCDAEEPELLGEEEDDEEIPAVGEIAVEAPSRDDARSLRQMFTINDKFRFRRELFGNSETEFADTLNLVSAMGSLAEAEDYFYGDLEWDADSEEVEAFMEIITRYFEARNRQDRP
ncbi:MAG: hypothetical protein K1V84_05395 [Muribaculaceae bacterium]